MKNCITSILVAALLWTAVSSPAWAAATTIYPGLVQGSAQDATNAGNIISGILSQPYQGIAYNSATSTAQLDKTSDTTLAAPVGLTTTTTLNAAGVYSCVGHLFVTSGAAGGIQVAVVGTGGLTATAFRFGAKGWNGTTLVSQASTTTLGTVIFSNAAVYTDVDIYGSITANVSGTLSVEFAQNTSNAATSSVFVGSFLKCDRTS